MKTWTRITALVACAAGLGIGLLPASPADAGPVRAESVTADPTPAPTAPVTPPPGTPAGTPAPAPGSTPSQPAPTPSLAPPSPSATTGEDSGPEDPAWYDVPGQVRKGVTDLIRWVGETGLRPVMQTLGSTILATPDLTGNERVKTAHATFKLIANSLLVLFVIAAGYLLVTRDSMQSRSAWREVGPRLLFAALAANTSMLVCGKAIEFTNVLAAAIVGPGVDGPAAAAVLQQAMFGGGAADGANASGLVIPMLIVAALVMALVVVVVFYLRLVMLTLLVAVAPMALMCHALPQTEGLARVWWKALLSVLGIQLASATILLVTVRVLLAPDGMLYDGRPSGSSALVSVCMAISMLWLLIKIPSWLKGFVLGPNQGRGLIRTVLGTVVAFKTLGALTRSSSSRRSTDASSSGAGSVPATSAKTSAATARPTSVQPTTTPMPRRPSPVGPAAFSSAPAVHAPLEHPMGQVQPAFSHEQRPSPTTVTPARGTTGSGFSHPPQRAKPLPRPAGPPPPRPRFSDPSGHASPALRSSAPSVAAPPKPAPPPVAFSQPVVPQSASKRPPAPVKPVFSSPPPPVLPRPTRRKKDSPS